MCHASVERRLSRMIGFRQALVDAVEACRRMALRWECYLRQKRFVLQALESDESALIAICQFMARRHNARHD